MSESREMKSQVCETQAVTRNALLSLVYAELRLLAERQMSGESADHTLQPTALVHEAWLRLTDSPEPINWENRGHFYSAAAEAMRRILVESARRRRSLKRGGQREKVELTDAFTVAALESEELLALHESLNRLAAEDPAKAELVTLRYFGGVSHQEAAATLGISRATADRYWAYAKVWLYVDMQRTEAVRT